jgi:lipoate---protein ligase
VTRPQPWARLGLAIGYPADLLARSTRQFDAMADHPVPTLWWYRPEGTAIVLGRGQRGVAVDTDLPVLERTSGGGAVLLDPGLLSLDVLVPAGHPLLDGDVGAVFTRVGAAWARALGELGVPDLSVHGEPSRARRQGSERDRLLAAICYATAGRGEVLAGGRKLVGLSQRRRRWGALIQCGLLRRWDPAPLLRALQAPPADREILDAAVGLDALVDQPPDEDTLMSTVEDAVAGYSEAAG